MQQLYIGLMSGTSLDGVDGVLVDFLPKDHSALKVLAHVHRPFAPSLASELLALNSPGENELHRAALAANAVAETYALVVDALLRDGGLPRDTIRAVGAHGQTVRHRPAEFDGVGYSVQLNAPALLAERAGMPVVADFRSGDVAAGGQGAPLVPAFHRAMFGRPGQALAVLNLGGFSNLTAIGSDGAILGFDCGPGNALLDLWCARQTGNAFDAEGRWAATGQVDQSLLAVMLDDPYFDRPPPKSTGRDLFNASWLEACLRQLPAPVRAQDVQCTLVELTARTSSAQVHRFAAAAPEVLVCGGGALNEYLMQRLAAALPGVHVRPTDSRGLPSLQVEACAFAWLARAHLDGISANIPAVTGARGARVLGALYPGRA